MDETPQDDIPEARPAPPQGIHAFDDAEARLLPLGPWAFLRPGLAGAFGATGWQILAAWVFLQVATSAAWAVHLRGFTRYAGGWSGLPQHWGEMLTAQDLWNLAVNGEMGKAPFGTLAPAFAALGVAWVLWASWKHQAEAAGLPARLRDWFLGALDALLIGLVPLLLPYLLALKILDAGAATGIQGLNWLAFAGKPLLSFALASALVGQWGLCRLNRAAAAGLGLLPFLNAYPLHLKDSFLRLWRHPVQWTALHLGGAALRAGLAFGALLLGWRWGGGTAGRVWALLGIQVLATAAGAFLLGWMLRLTARYWRRCWTVRRELDALEASRDRSPAAGPPSPDARPESAVEAP
ncbi:MAG: hypothetical protein U0P81_00215 [Holophagaceae bacterium]